MRPVYMSACAVFDDSVSIAASEFDRRDFASFATDSQERDSRERELAAKIS